MCSRPRKTKRGGQCLGPASDLSYNQTEGIRLKPKSGFPLFLFSKPKTFDKIAIKCYAFISPFKEVKLIKEQIIAQIKNDVYCRLRPSGISGVGVFAIRDIPAGTNPFKEEDTEYVSVTKEELAGTHPEALRVIKDLLVFADGCYWIPKQGVQTLCISHFLNHSENPNLTTSREAENFFAIRDIKTGEELTVDYTIFDEADSNFEKPAE